MKIIPAHIDFYLHYHHLLVGSYVAGGDYTSLYINYHVVVVGSHVVGEDYTSLYRFQFTLSFFSSLLASDEQV